MACLPRPSTIHPQPDRVTPSASCPGNSRAEQICWTGKGPPVKPPCHMECIPAASSSMDAGPLTCNVAGGYSPPADLLLKYLGSDVGVQFGVTTRFGGIGVALNLYDSKTEPFNIVSAMSAAGAAIQTSYIIVNWNKNWLVFNQAAGNDIGYQWGYGTGFVQKSISLQGTSNPLWADHVTQYAISPNGPDRPLSPCDLSNTNYMFDAGAPATLLNGTPTSHGTAIRIDNSYAMTSAYDQNWAGFYLEQAMYLDTNAAQTHQSTMTVAVSGPGGVTLDVFSPYEPVHSCLGSCASDGSSCGFGANTQYVVVTYVLNGGKIVGVAVPLHNQGLSFLRGSVSIQLHNWMCGTNYPDTSASCPTQIANGQVRTYTQTYYVGTPEQLSDLGFAVATSSSCSR